MIIVMPDANRGQRGYFNSISGDWRYEDFFFEELMPYVEKTYRIKGEKRYRAVAGLSMGGGGSFMYALHHPEQQSYFEAHSALSLIENTPAKVLKTVRWFIDCGDDDFLYEGNSLVHIALRKKEVAHEYRVRDGGHSWTYWRASLPVVLEFISDAFHQH